MAKGNQRKADFVAAAHLGTMLAEHANSEDWKAIEGTLVRATMDAFDTDEGDEISDDMFGALEACLSSAFDYKRGGSGYQPDAETKELFSELKIRAGKIK